MFKDVKMIQCQRLPAVDGKVSVKFLRDMILDENTNYKTNDIKKVEVNKIFKAKIDIVNRTKGTISQIEY